MSQWVWRGKETSLFNGHECRANIYELLVCIVLHFYPFSGKSDAFIWQKMLERDEKQTTNKKN